MYILWVDFGDIKTLFCGWGMDIFWNHKLQHQVFQEKQLFAKYFESFFFLLMCLFRKEISREMFNVPFTC